MLEPICIEAPCAYQQPKVKLRLVDALVIEKRNKIFSKWECPMCTLEYQFEMELNDGNRSI